VANDVEVVAVTNIVPNALLKKQNLIAIAEECTLESGERFFVDAHCIWFTQSEFHQLANTNTQDSRLVMPALVAGIHVLKTEQDQRRGWPGQARP